MLPERYRLWPDASRARLGSGGAATVWRVQDQDLGVLVALKVLKDTRPGFISKMEREAVLSSRVVHPNVVAVHDIGRTPDGHGYLAFALASDGTMLDVASKPPRWPELLDLTLQLLEALAAMHARGILHLDVKLSNLLLHRSASGKRLLWLADLGVARALWDDDEDKSVVGTVSYMSPERLTGQHHLWCPSTDLFAVGGVLYRLITGRLPYPARDPAEGLAQRQRPPQTLVPRQGVNVPKELGEVLLPMLQFDRRARYDLAADAIRAFRGLPQLYETPLVENPAGHPQAASPPGVPRWHRPPPVEPPATLPLSANLQNRRVPQAPSLLRQREIAIVGREPEMELLWRSARTALRTGRPVLVEITGAKGSGRTRLLQAFTRALEEAGLGEGVRMQYAVPDGPNLGLRGAWRRIMPPGSRRDLFIREIAGTFSRDRGSSLDQCINDARLMASWLGPGEAGRVTYNRSAIRAMMVEHLERRAWRGLSWLWVEDAHMAGGTDDCWAIIDQLLLQQVPAIVLVDADSEQVPASLLELRARHHRSVRRIQLERLRGREAEALVDAHLPLDPELTGVLTTVAGNQPKLVKELLIHWVQTGELVERASSDRRGRVWSLTRGVPALPPDGRALAQARLSATQPGADGLLALQAIALAGQGAPLDVITRISEQGLDELVLAGLVDIQQERCVLQPDELAQVVLDGLSPSTRRCTDLHAALADAWAEEGDSPGIHHQVGRHRFAAGQEQAALPSLRKALDHLAATLPVQELTSLARKVLTAAKQTSGADAAWLDASLVLADALWRADEGAQAHEVDSLLVSQDLPANDRMRVLCGRIRRSDPDEAEQVDLWLAEAKALLPHVRTPHRADYHVTRAWICAARLDVDGALAEVLDALSCRPDPVVGCRARVLRARLLSSIDPMVAWHDALRVAETARDYGFLRYQVLAWGLAADSMVFLGRSEEAIERLQSGIQRLDAHGEVLAARSAQLQLGMALMAAGRDTSARDTWENALGRDYRAHPATVLGPRASLALLGALRGEDRRVMELLPGEAPTDLPTRAAWGLLLPIAELRAGLTAIHLPDATQLRQSVALGMPGLFATLALIAEMRRAGRRSQATSMERVFTLECTRLGVDPEEARPWLDRARRSRRS